MAVQAARGPMLRSVQSGAEVQIPVLNGSFEDPVLAPGSAQVGVPVNWYGSDDTSGGILYTQSSYLPVGPKDGNQVLYLNNISSVELYKIYQDFFRVGVAGRTYTLTASHVARSDSLGPAPGIVQLLSDGAVVASTTFTPTANVWNDAVLSYTALQDKEELTIVLGKNTGVGGEGQIFYDAITFSADGPVGTYNRVSISNAGFEVDIVDVGLSMPNLDSWNPVSSGTFWPTSHVSGGAKEGNNTAYLAGDTAQISQTLGSTAIQGRTYVLNFYIAERTDVSASSVDVIFTTTGKTPDNINETITPVAVAGEWEKREYEFIADADDDGNTIYIQFNGTSAGQILFDDVRVYEST